ncbi:MAG: hypothetical protein LBP75_07055 [Planctomycetota bacterium]|jgi:hypothetical protein|nr:hypothetical protein [Planctomycetota bacterium]
MKTTPRGQDDNFLPEEDLAKIDWSQVTRHPAVRGVACWSPPNSAPRHTEIDDRRILARLENDRTRRFYEQLTASVVSMMDNQREKNDGVAV